MFFYRLSRKYFVFSRNDKKWKTDLFLSGLMTNGGRTAIENKKTTTKKATAERQTATTNDKKTKKGNGERQKR